MNHTSYLRLTVFLAAASLLAGCGGRSDEPGDAAAPMQARSEVEHGPVRITLEVDPARPRLSDQPTMTLSIESEPGVKVDKPVFGESIGEFRIVGTRESLPQINNRRHVFRQTLTLEPTRTGRQEIYAIPVTYTDARPDGDGKRHTVETEPLQIEVVSMIDSEVRSLDKLHEERPPVALPESGWSLWKFATGLALFLAAGTFAWWWRRKRRRKAVPQKELSPQERARLELEQLWESGLAERDVKLYYVELTGVVRRYIERTTGVRAPERTTEEFLREIGGRATFPAEESGRLKDFLESADLVKFAAHQPRWEDVRESYDRAGAFVGRPAVEVAA